MRLQKKDIIELRIENLGINGEGISRVDGETVFIKGALPGEIVRAEVILDKKNFAVAKLLSIEHSSADRVSPPCPFFGKCGGCSLQHLGYPAQLDYKRRTIRETFAKIAGLDVEVQDVFPSDKIYGYRNKISLPVRRTRGKIGMGFFMQNSHNIIDIDRCLLQKEEINDVLVVFKRFLAEYGGNPYDEEDGTGDIRHLIVRSLGGRLYITVVTKEPVDISGFEKMLKATFDDYSLYLNYNTKKNNVILGDVTRFVGGATSEITVEGLKIKPHPASFFQVNDYIREKIYSYATQSIASPYVIDAYSGGGVMTAIIARNAEKVYGVEINKAAHEAAVALKKDNDIANMHPMLGDVADIIKSIAKENCAVVLDPPRGGCDEKVLDILKTSSNRIVYISCNPKTLARDLKILGGKILAVKPFDMFCQTPQIETVVTITP